MDTERFFFVYPKISHLLEKTYMLCFEGLMKDRQTQLTAKEKMGARALIPLNHWKSRMLCFHHIPWKSNESTLLCDQVRFS